MCAHIHVCVDTQEAQIHARFMRAIAQFAHLSVTEAEHGATRRHHQRMFTPSGHLRDRVCRQRLDGFRSGALLCVDMSEPARLGALKDRCLHA